MTAWRASACGCHLCIAVINRRDAESMLGSLLQHLNISGMGGCSPLGGARGLAISPHGARGAVGVLGSTLGGVGKRCPGEVMDGAALVTTLLLELPDSSSALAATGDPSHLGGVLLRPKYAWKIVRAMD